MTNKIKLSIGSCYKEIKLINNIKYELYIKLIEFYGGDNNCNYIKYKTYTFHIDSTDLAITLSNDAMSVHNFITKIKDCNLILCEKDELLLKVYKVTENLLTQTR